jgi:hypothetical protein
MTLPGARLVDSLLSQEARLHRLFHVLVGKYAFRIL